MVFSSDQPSPQSKVIQNSAETRVWTQSFVKIWKNFESRLVLPQLKR